MVLQKIEDLRDQSGQVLALGALSMLVLALMLMLSFNLSEAIHNKIQLQQQADAQAYSMAVVEARTFNYIAYSNRAIAADLVAMATMHAYMSMMSSEVDMLGAAEVNMFIIAGEEFLLCCSCGPPFVCCKLQHCWHGVQAIIKGLKFSRYKGKYGKKLKGLESMFNRSIMFLRRMIDAIHISQVLMLYDTAQVLRGQKLDEIRTFNDPQSSKKLPALVQVKNVENLLCGVQGTPLDSLCPHNKISKQQQAKLLGEVANATRPKFTTDRGILDIYKNLASKFGLDLMHNIQGNGVSLPISHEGTAKLTPGRSGLTSSQEGIDAKDVGAEDHGWLFSIFHDGFSFFPYNAHIYSDSSGGEHKPGEAHQGRHGEFKGLHSCMLTGSCFIKFRADAKVKDNYDQPLVYYYATRDLSVTRKGGHGPWELNSQGKVEMKWGSNTGTVILRAGKGAALSQAMVYYHRLGDWKDAPNLFSPYWRAKLHPMTGTTAAEVLLFSGNTDAAEVAGAPGTPVN